MKRPERVDDYLDHIAESAQRIDAYVAGVDLAAFKADSRTQDAVVRNVEIIGEAATQIMERYPDFAAAHPQVPWQAMRGMRNRMAHGYFEIDDAILWDTVQQDIPALLQQVRDILPGPSARQQDHD
jgi:uncharacterized protein with HEPN domain